MGGELLRMAMENVMTQWVEENTRFKIVFRKNRTRINEEDYTVGRYDYSKANFRNLDRYFEHAEWTEFEVAVNLEGKRRKLLMIYNEGVRKHVLSDVTK